MRKLLFALMLLALSPLGHACSCFPPEVRAKTARDTLQLAHLAVYGRVEGLSADGRARILVLESFKGASMGSFFETKPTPSQCETPPFALKEEVLIISFEDAASSCDKHPPDHYLLEEFRLNAAKDK